MIEFSMQYDGMVAADFKGALNAAMRVAVERGVAVATASCPVDTGSLRGSIRWEETPDGYRLLAGGGGFLKPDGTPTSAYAEVQELTHATQRGFLLNGANEIARGFAEQAPKELRNAARRARYSTARLRGLSSQRARAFRDRR